MVKKLIAMTALLAFVVVAGYLCACVSMNAPSAAFEKEHSCCSGMPDCPMKDCKESGMMSFLPLFTSKIGQGIQIIKHPALNDTTISKIVQSIEKSPRNLALQKTASIDLTAVSPPDLFIKHRVLLI